MKKERKLKPKIGRPKVDIPTDENKEALNKAARIFGTNISFIKAINITEGVFYKWKRGEKWMSYKMAFKIEGITNGKVKATDLLPK